MKRNKAFSATALLLGISAAASASNLVTNGGFETGDLTGWTINPTIVGLWKTTKSGVDAGLVPNSGTYFVDTGCVEILCLAHGTSTANDLSQVLTTVAGQSYTLSFYTSNPPSQPSPSELDVYWGGNLVVALNPVPGAAPNYTQYTGTVTATGTSTDLEFLGRQDPSYLALDDVSVVTAVPLPASAWLLLSGLGVGGLGLVARRRQRDSLAPLAAI